MLGFRNVPINDINPIIIKYWDNSVLLVNCGFHIAVKSPIDITYEWLSTKQDGEKFAIARSRKGSAQALRNTITILNPTKYINSSLYYDGHLDSDIIRKLEVQPKALEQSITDTEELAKQFDNLVSNPIRSLMAVTVGTTSALLTELQAPMDTENLPQTAPKGTIAPNTTEHNDASSPLDDDADVEMEDDEDVSALHATSTDDVDRLQPADYNKYTVTNNFNPKSFKSGRSLGYVNVKEATCTCTIHRLNC